MIFKKRTKEGHDNTLTSIGVYIFFNALILLALVFVIKIYYTNSYTHVVNEKYYSILMSDIESVEKDIRNITNGVSHLKNSDFDSCMSYYTADFPKPAQISSTISSFQNYIANYEIADSVMIINKTLDTVISNVGMYDLKTYFEENCKYEDYPHSYWHNYKMPLYHVQMLPPTQVTSFGESKKIIPIVFSSVKDTISSNLLVFNISVDKILTQNNINNNLTPNSRFYIVNSFNNSVFHSENTPKPDEKLAEFLVSSNLLNNGKYDVKENRYEDNLVVRYSSTSHILGYEYVVIIPLDDIPELADINKVSNLMLVIIALCIIGWFIIGRSKIIMPVGEIVSDAKRYKEDVETMLPVVREKFVSDIINSPLAYADGSVSDVLSKNRTAFKYNTYLAIIVKYVIDTKNLQNDTILDKNNIISEISKEIKLALSEFYDTVNICINNDSLYVVSLEDETHKPKIVDIVEGILNNHRGNDAVMFSLGIGNVYSGRVGIKQSVESANYDLLKCVTPEEIKKNFGSGGKAKYIYTKQDEDKLFNLLVAGYCDEPMQLISEIIRTNMARGISEAQQKELYRHIYDTIIRVMDMKEINYKSPSNDSSMDYIISILQGSNDEIYKGIMKAVSEISVKTKKYNTKLDFSQIVRYIDEHYAEDLYLDIIALHFGTSSKYLSRKLKQHLGVNFHKYLSQIRINHAKILLTSTDMPINEVGRNVGYMNGTTFARTFKAETGLSPAMYKKQGNEKKMGYRGAE